MQPDQQERSVA